MMRGYMTPNAILTQTAVRWDSAAVGQRTGAKKIEVPATAQSLLFVTNAPIYVVCAPGAAAYAADCVTIAWGAALVGCLFPINAGAIVNDSTRPPHQIPVVAGQWIHVLDESGAGTLYSSFLGE